jgi:hypothetical protein
LSADTISHSFRINAGIHPASSPTNGARARRFDAGADKNFGGEFRRRLTPLVSGIIARSGQRPRWRYPVRACVVPARAFDERLSRELGYNLTRAVKNTLGKRWQAQTPSGWCVHLPENQIMVAGSATARSFIAAQSAIRLAVSKQPLPAH